MKSIEVRERGKAGERLFIHGASGSVGQAAVQLVMNDGNCGKTVLLP